MTPGVVLVSLLLPLNKFCTIKLASDNLCCNPFMHNDEKWPNILQKSDSVNTAMFPNYVRLFFNIKDERANLQ